MLIKELVYRITHYYGFLSVMNGKVFIPRKVSFKAINVFIHICTNLEHCVTGVSSISCIYNRISNYLELE
jgi:hypothetical protein